MTRAECWRTEQDTPLEVACGVWLVTALHCTALRPALRRRALLTSAWSLPGQISRVRANALCPLWGGFGSANVVGFQGGDNLRFIHNSRHLLLLLFTHCLLFLPVWKSWEMRSEVQRRSTLPRVGWFQGGSALGQAQSRCRHG